MYWDTYLSTDDIVVTYRVDKEPAKQQLWEVTSDFKGAGFFRAGPPIGLVRQMSGHERLYVRVTPHGSAPVDAVFDISGIDEAAKPLMKACDWTMGGLPR